MRPIKLATLALAMALALNAPAGAQGALFFSEYVEGSSFNKAVEIYNGASVALSGHTVEIYYNGAKNPGSTIVLSGTVAAGDVWVLAHPSGVLGLAPDQTSSGLTFNGDDAVVLRRSGTVVDSIGRVGQDPGTQWGAGLASTADNTLRRKPSVCAGDTTTSDASTRPWSGTASPPTPSRAWARTPAAATRSSTSSGRSRATAPPRPWSARPWRPAATW